jgi:subtilisin family serine protease
MVNRGKYKQNQRIIGIIVLLIILLLIIAGIVYFIGFGKESGVSRDSETEPEKKRFVIAVGDDEELRRKIIEEVGEENVVQESKGGIELNISEEELGGLRDNDELSSEIDIIEGIPVTINLQDSVDIMNISQAWLEKVNGVNLTGASETVCVLDTGMKLDHPDLSSKYLGGYDYVNEDGNPSDDNGHGTHVAGIVAANGGIDGVAKGAGLVILKVLNSNGDGSSIDLDEGLQWCLDNRETYNISVMTMSLAVDCDNYPQYCYNVYCDGLNPTTTSLINQAVGNNTMVFGAAGNDGNATHIAWPSCIQNLTPIGAVDKSDNVAGYSNRNSLIKLFATGSSVNSTSYSGGYTVKSGTSMATPHVAGMAAVIYQYLDAKGQSMTNEEIEDLLNETGLQFYDAGSGVTFGRVSLYEALESIDVLSITWENPTPGSGTTVDTDNVYLNVSFDSIQDRSAFFDWNKSLAGYWGMDDYNSSGVYDNSSYDSFGVFNGGLGVGDLVTGKYGNALEFDGVDDYIDVSDNDLLDFDDGDNYSIGFWIKHSENLTDGKYRRFLQKAATPPLTGYNFAVEGSTDKVVFWARDGVTPKSIGSGTTFTDGVWHHVVGIRNGSNAYLYVDGVLENSTDSFISGNLSNNASFIIGHKTFDWPDAEFFKGSLDEIVIFRRALSADEVKALYDNTANRLENNFTDLEDGNYNYQAYVINEGGILNKSDLRTVTVNTTDTTSPLISYEPETEADNAIVARDNIYVNVSVTEDNLASMAYTLYNESLNVSGLVGYWNFDRDLSLQPDLSGNGNDETAVGHASYTASGKLEGAYEFDGDGDYIEAADSTSLDIPGALTLSFWMKSDSLIGDDGALISKSADNAKWFSGPSNKVYEIGILNNIIYFQVSNGSINGLIAESSTSLTDGNWHHVVATWNGSEGDGSMLYYFDGSEVAEDTEIAPTFTQIQAISSTLNMGGQNSGAYSFNGSIDEVIIFNRSLSEAEVENLYNRSVVDRSSYGSKTSDKNWTGLQTGEYHYFVDILDDGDNYNSTEIRTITLEGIPVGDTSAPNVSIVYPVNTTYYSNVTELNYTYEEDTAGDSCWYSINGGISNSTPVVAGQNFTNVISSEGSNTWTVWCNDTSNNQGSDSVIFSNRFYLGSGLDDLNLSYSTGEIASLYSLYDNQTGSVIIDNETWYYTGDAMAGRSIGEGWEENGYYYIKLGSGITTEAQGGDGGSNGTGYVNVSITTTLAIEVIQEDVDFGEGAVDAGESNAELYTNQDNAPTQNRGNWTLPNAYAIEIRNVGNINCSLDVGSSKTASSFLGGTNPEYQWKVSDKEAGSCGGGLTHSVWYDVNSSARLCQHFSPINASDEIFLDIRVVVPYDANPTGSLVHKTDILTLTASATA